MCQQYVARNCKSFTQAVSLLLRYEFTANEINFAIVDVGRHNKRDTVGNKITSFWMDFAMVSIKRLGQNSAFDQSSHGLYPPTQGQIAELSLIPSKRIPSTIELITHGNTLARL